MVGRKDEGMKVMESLLSAENVRSCYLLGLTVSYGASEFVRRKQTEYLNRLLEIGVAGFRVDAAKHMWPGGRNIFLCSLSCFSTQPSSIFFYKGPGGYPRSHGDQGFQAVGEIDFGWGMCQPGKAFVFVENHNQKRHGGAGGDAFVAIVHRSYMLAYPYGLIRIMSSYFFESTDEGFPTRRKLPYNTLDVTIKPDGSCRNGWVSEHSWATIPRMVLEMELKYCLGVLLLGLSILKGTQGYFDPHCDGKQVIVHLFEWKWTSIAEECERFLSSAGYCGVQVSPVHEHVIVTSPMRPWWERYQPVSYKLTSRSGTDEEFADMVRRCNAVGVRIYVDAVLNHMAGLGRSGTGTAGSSFDSDAHDFPGVPFSRGDFTPRDMCPSGDGDTNLLFIEDLAAILSQLRTLNPDHGFKQGRPPFFFHEVIDRNDGAVTVDEYFHLGRVTEFRYSQKIAWGINDFGQLGGLVDFGWGMCPSDKAFVFVDNHDNQRGHGGAGDVLTHKNPFLYKLGVCYMLAHPYGFTRVMSSYYFENTDEGPPHDENYNTLDVPINPDGSCGNEDAMEFLSLQKAGFRNAVQGTDMANYYNDGERAAFSRGDRGFFALSKSGSMNQVLQTGMPAGTYCNIIDDCATQVTVNGDGTAQIVITNSEDPILAICQGCNGETFPTPDPTATTEPTTQGPTEPPITDGTHRTVIFIQQQTMEGQDMFVRGGVGHDQRPGCTEDAATSACAISMTTNSLGETAHYSKYNSWREGDTKLDWYGVQPGQGTSNGQPADGTPLAWTSNAHYGEHYWMVDTDMDCSHTEGGWFELKAYVTNGVGWETDVNQAGNCGGSAGGSAPYSSPNHMGKCGYLNVFKFSNPSCTIEKIG
ncbi:unnamed protein product [Darwinula stevensoni]|uniref:alpha-amylase n=1 Tax=Darwinula stevensoni TaxID=69355 RepID=A0A7R8X0W4_9CRUS|nr:unnamed protein product [Darwinula stevensoni]CAG0879313.1 unnamed protein product [Darwinula stevensoni]